MGVDPGVFYATAAGVLPVFYLTLAFEQNQSAFFSEEVASAFASPDSRGVRIFRSAYSLWVTMSIAVGESAAFVGLVNDFPLRFDLGSLGQIVVWALAIGGFGVVAPLVVVQVDQLWRALPNTAAPAGLTLARVGSILGTLGVATYLVYFVVWALNH